MATAIHSANHARMIAGTVVKFHKREMVDDLMFPICAMCSAYICNNAPFPKLPNTAIKQSRIHAMDITLKCGRIIQKKEVHAWF